MEELAELFRAARDLQTFCEERDWAFCFIGGIAVQRPLLELKEEPGIEVKLQRLFDLHLR